jgi:hypothetical protein
LASFKRLAPFVCIFSCCFFLSCAHYYLPANHFQVSETAQESRVAVLDVLFTSGTNLTDPPVLKVKDSVSELKLQSVQAVPALRLALPLSKRSEIAFCLQASAPLLLTYKNQVVGSQTLDSFSLSLGGGGGFLVGNQGSAHTTYTLFEGFVSSGYRLSEKHLFWLSPFFSFAQLSGVSTLQVSSANQFGINLGYQYSIESLLLRSEVSWIKGSMGQSIASGFSGGASFGLSL